jgi:carbon-monoxide dehydrogenase iron sulfur subunit
MKGSIFVELRKCLACHSCELACAVEHSASKDLVQALQEDPPPVARVYVEDIDGTGVPLQCRHCEDAPCVSVCPRKAIEKLGSGQSVIIDAEKCTGCNFCVAACPFGVVVVPDDRKTAVKCDLCPQRIKEGLEPACVSVCPNGALCFGTGDELQGDQT